MFIVSLFAAVRHAFNEWQRRQQAYAELMALDDRSLADIGIRRSEIPAIVEGHHEASARRADRDFIPAFNSQQAGRRPHLVSLVSAALSDADSARQSKRPAPSHGGGPFSFAQHQRRPPVDHDAGFQRKPLRAIGGEHAGLLPAQQAGEDRRAARRERIAPDRAPSASAAGRGYWRRPGRGRGSARRPRRSWRAPGRPRRRCAAHGAAPRAPRPDRGRSPRPRGAAACAAAIARMPLPVPMSRGRRKRRRRASRSNASRQPRVDGCSPVPKAVAASISIATAPGRRACRANASRGPETARCVAAETRGGSPRANRARRPAPRSDRRFCPPPPAAASVSRTSSAASTSGARHKPRPAIPPVAPASRVSKARDAAGQLRRACGDRSAASAPSIRPRCARAASVRSTSPGESRGPRRSRSSIGRVGPGFRRDRRFSEASRALDEGVHHLLVAGVLEVDCRACCPRRRGSCRSRISGETRDRRPKTRRSS